MEELFKMYKNLDVKERIKFDREYNKFKKEEKLEQHFYSDWAKENMLNLMNEANNLQLSTNPTLVIPDVSNRFILDACCGSRMFWFDKENPNCLFIDKRSETIEAKDSSQKSGLRTIEVKPDLIADFTEMPFKNETFAMVVFDPPHLKTLGQNSWMAKKYGRLPDDWQFMIQKGFKECMRVLKPQGTLIFKWNEYEISSKQILDLIPYKPLFGHTSGKQAKTIWMAFMKGVS